jgi:hypothetical protein
MIDVHLCSVALRTSSTPPLGHYQPHLPLIHRIPPWLQRRILLHRVALGFILPERTLVGEQYHMLLRILEGWEGDQRLSFELLGLQRLVNQDISKHAKNSVNT